MTDTVDPESHYRSLFENAPVSLWEEDYSQVKQALERLRAAGVADLDAYLCQHPQVVEECMGLIRVLDVNRKTLELFKAPDKATLLANLDKIFRAEMRRHFRDELLDMWQGRLVYDREGINYTLAGAPVYIHLYWEVFPGYEHSWEKVMVSLVDLTARRQAEQRQQESEQRYRGLFENAPISMWEEDYSLVKHHLDGLRQQGVKDLAVYLDEHPGQVQACLGLIRVLDVNRKTLELFGAGSKEELLDSLDHIFRDEVGVHFRDELLDMWRGRLAYEREGINYSLAGEPIDIQLHWAVFPGCEDTWERVLVSITDITARKRAEQYLKYLGTHDALTGLYNRAFYQDELARLELEGNYPVSIVIIDLDELKITNDTLGHAAGDELLRRTAEVLKAGLRPQDILARIGGDEFAALLPGADEKTAEQLVADLYKLVSLNNAYYRRPRLSFSAGTVTAWATKPLVEAQRLADDAMYSAKRQRKQRP